MINKLSQEIHENAVSKGFYEKEKNIGEMLCLIHSEVSEALEADRKKHFAKANLEEAASVLPNYTAEMILRGLADHNYGHMLHEDESFKRMFEVAVKNTFEDELADVMIRVMDLAEYKGIDLEKHILAKMRYNYLREYKHGKEY